MITFIKKYWFDIIIFGTVIIGWTLLLTGVIKIK